MKRDAVVVAVAVVATLVTMVAVKKFGPAPMRALLA
jgi:hypothetical protein